MRTAEEIIARVEPPGALGEPLKGALGNRAAKAIHEALDAAGMAIVPTEPTKEMIDAAEDALEEHKDSDWGSTAGGDRESYTYYTSGAARDMYLAALAATPERKRAGHPEG